MLKFGFHMLNRKQNTLRPKKFTKRPTIILKMKSQSPKKRELWSSSHGISLRFKTSGKSHLRLLKLRRLCPRGSKREEKWKQRMKGLRSFMITYFQMTKLNPKTLRFFRMLRSGKKVVNENNYNLQIN